ncbi:PTS transporter subunit EIIC [Lachnospiraceae bacterium 54-53]
MQKYADMAKAIIENIGGNTNVDTLVHCATRLRFTLKDPQLADKEKMKEIAGVLGVVESGGQIQIIIGNAVPDVYAAISEAADIRLEGTVPDEIGEEKSKGNILNRAISTIAALFSPLLGVMCGSGVVKGLLMLLTTVGWLDKTGGSYAILYAAADALFYFLPVLLAITASKRFGANTFVAATIAGAMIYPNIISMIGTGGGIDFAGIPVTLINYSSTVIPILVTVYLLSHVEKLLKKYIPEAVRTFLVPAISLITVVPVAFIIIGPIVTVVADGLASGYTAIYNFNPIIAGAFVGAAWQLLVVFGVHWTFVPIIMNNISIYGRDTLTAMIGPSNFAQAGASLGVFLKTKNQALKQVAGSAAIAGIFGITEPTIYGVTLRYKRTFGIAVVISAISGALSGMFNCGAIASGVPGLLTLPIYMGEGFIAFLFICAFAYFGTAAITFLFGFNDKMIEK